MTLGIAVLITLYLCVTLAYHLVLTLPEIAAAATERGSPRVVAAVFFQRLLGQSGLIIISLVVMGSTLISLNGNALSGPRAYFAMARDGLFPRFLCHIHPRFQTPANSIVAQAVWSIALIVAATAMLVLEPPAPGAYNLPAWLQKAWTTLHDEPLYDVMYNYVIFGATLIYLMTVASIFVLRARHPDWHRPYRTTFYPVTPILFTAAATLLLGSMIAGSTFQSLAGLAVILAGIPAFLLFSRTSPPPPLDSPGKHHVS